MPPLAVAVAVSSLSLPETFSLYLTTTISDSNRVSEAPTYTTSAQPCGVDIASIYRVSQVRDMILHQQQPRIKINHVRHSTTRAVADCTRR